MAVFGRVTIASDAYYFFGRDGTTATTLRAFKATAPDTSWAAGATKTGFTTAILTLAGYQSGTVIHLLVCDGTSTTSVATKYVSYDAATDTFLATIETVAAAVATSGQSSFAPVGGAIVVRANGEAVAFYNGLQTKTSGTFRSRLYYRRRTGVNTWSTETQVDANAAQDTHAPIAVLGSADRVHLFWCVAGGTVGYRTLSAANVLNTANVTANMNIPGDGVSYDRSGTTKVVVTSSSTGQTVLSHDSSDNPTPTVVNLSIAAASAPHRIGADETTDEVTIVYRSTADSDLYAIKSTDDGATFGAPVLFFAGTIANNDISVSRSVSGSLYQRGSQVVVGYVVNDNNTWKYNEYVISTSSPNVTVTPTGVSAATARGTATAAGVQNVSVAATGISASAVVGTATVTIGSAAVNVTATPAGVSASAASGAASGPLSSFITSATPGPDRNDFSGEVGIRFGIGASDITVSWIGVYVRTASGTRKLNLYDGSDALQRTVTVDFTGKTAGQYVWTAITPITLTAGSICTLLQEVTASDGLIWADLGPVTGVVSGISSTVAAYRATAGSITTYLSDNMYVGLDLGVGSAGGSVTVTTGAGAAPAGVTATSAIAAVAVTAVRNLSTSAAGVAATATVGTATVAAAQHVTASPTGVSASAALGTASASTGVSTSATGQTAAATIGTATAVAAQNAAATPTGVAAASAAGSVVVTIGAAANGFSIAANIDYWVYSSLLNNDVTSIDTTPPGNPVGYDNWSGEDAATGAATPAGVTATAAIGAVVVTAAQSVAATPAGVTATALAGTVAVAASAQASAQGVAATALAGAATVTTIRNAAATPLGVTASSASGSASVAVGGGISVGTSGQALTASVGTAAVTAVQTVAAAASGVAAAAAVGTPAVAVLSSVSAQGVAASALTGSATVTAKQFVTVAPLGVAASTALGGISTSVGGGVSIQPSAVTASAQVGAATVTAKQAVTVAPTGVVATTALGTPSASVAASVAPASVAAAAVVGAATVTAKQAVTVAATGVAASAASGNVGIAVGNSISVSAGSFAATALTGSVTVTAKQAVTVTPLGVAASAQFGIASAVGTVGGAGVWNGTAWVQKPVKVWNGSAWVAKPVWNWDGAKWAA